MGALLRGQLVLPRLRIDTLSLLTPHMIRYKYRKRFCGFLHGHGVACPVSKRCSLTVACCRESVHTNLTRRKQNSKQKDWTKNLCCAALLRLAFVGARSCQNAVGCEEVHMRLTSYARTARHECL